MSLTKKSMAPTFVPQMVGMNDFPPEICSWEYTTQGMAGPLLSRGDSPDLICQKNHFALVRPEPSVLMFMGL